jgi:hypothetical protein
MELQSCPKKVYPAGFEPRCFIPEASIKAITPLRPGAVLFYIKNYLSKVQPKNVLVNPPPRKADFFARSEQNDSLSFAA